MNQLIELHDSRIALVSFEGRTAKISFSHAYIHQSSGEPGVDSGTGWSQQAELMIKQAGAITLPRSWPCEIYDGFLELDGQVHENSIPIPLEHEGAVKLVLAVYNEDENFTIQIVGRAVKLTLLGQPRYVEDFPGQA